jgi:hypothetical protein
MNKLKRSDSPLDDGQNLGVIAPPVAGVDSAKGGSAHVGAELAKDESAHVSAAPAKDESAHVGVRAKQTVSPATRRAVLRRDLGIDSPDAPRSRHPAQR